MRSRAFDAVQYIFLDRDGVINVKLPPHRFVTGPEVLSLCVGAAAAIARLNALNIKVFVVTNQRGIARGLFTEAQLEQVHQRLKELLAAHGAHLDAIYYCPHDRDCCDCRKPLPGMFHQAFAAFPGASPANSLMVGDSFSDILAGNNLDLPTVFVEGDPSTQDPGAEQARSLASCQAPTLASFVEQYF